MQADEMRRCMSVDNFPVRRKTKIKIELILSSFYEPRNSSSKF